MDLEEKIDLILRSPTEEIITMEELRELLQTNEHPVAYDGFEPSGLAHLGSGLLRAIKLNDMLKAGCKFKLLIADWFAWINNKMNGDLEKIQQVGKYLIEVWKACGIDTNKIDIIWTSNIIDNKEYWRKVIEVAKLTTINRMLRCCTIMGREEKELLYIAQLFYPAMQAADPFELGIDICQLGMDQRHATILSREVAEKIGYKKPVCVHHHLLIGLLESKRMGSDQAGLQSIKMSKSKPDTAIFIHDSPEEIKRKITNAFCPQKIIENNPIIDICKHIIFREVEIFKIERPSKFGGNMEFHNFEELEKTYKEGKLHPLDLKNAVAEELIKILEPVRKYFEKNKKAKELLEVVKQAKITKINSQ